MTIKIFYLIGFINFRLKGYFNLLNEILTEGINSYIIEKEYDDFVSLLKVYVEYNPSNIDVCHLIYSPSESELLDKLEIPIKLNTNISNTKYLSDISFSNNDYILNTLLDLLPEKIYIHTNEEYIDEFVNSILLIFEDAASICTDPNCLLCNSEILNNV